jgi:hypothetical protein
MVFPFRSGNDEFAYVLPPSDRTVCTDFEWWAPRRSALARDTSPVFYRAMLDNILEHRDPAGVRMTDAKVDIV